ncbi:MAG TPA: hypothetical protein VKB43_12735 [Gaiellaceae bacterium]|nr:hypothetical protein [Gaiellaceae bacterium]
MQRRSGIWVVSGIAAAVVVTASAYAAPAPRTPIETHVLDSTYSCQVRPERYVDLDASVTIKPEPGQVEPAQARVTTLPKTIQRNGVDYNLPQILFQNVKNSLEVDNSTCRRSSRKVSLKAAGLPPYETVTPTFVGEIQARCTSTKRVLVRFRIALKNHTPQQALIAVRNDDAKGRRLAFLNWRPRKISSRLAKSCVSLSG